MEMKSRYVIIVVYVVFILLIGFLSSNRSITVETDDNSLPIAITFTKGRIYDSDYTIARIKITDINQMKTVFASAFYDQRTENVSVLASRENAVFAVNGDYYRFKEDGFVCRNGEVFRNSCNGSRDVLIIDNNGDFHIERFANNELIKPYIENVYQGFTFGPGLVVKGSKQTEFVDNDNSAFKPAQRMCIAQIGYLEYLFIAVEGPESINSQGITVEQLADFVYGIGDIQNAYNLDGGMSTTMIYQGEKVNSPAKERPVCDIICFFGAEKQGGVP